MEDGINRDTGCLADELLPLRAVPGFTVLGISGLNLILQESASIHRVRGSIYRSISARLN